MKFSKWSLRLGTATASLALVAALPSGLAVAKPPPRPAPAGPLVKLIAAQKKISVPQFGKSEFLDPGVYVAAFGSKLEFTVQRATYSEPLTITEVIHVPGKGIVLRPLPRKLADGWNGLARFLRITIRNDHGKIVATRISPFCPNSFSPQRATPNSPRSSPFPLECSSDPFEKGMVLGVQRGWGSDGIGGFGLKLKRGFYRATVNIMQPWRKVLHISKSGDVATVRFRVVKAPRCDEICFGKPGHITKTNKTLPSQPAVPTVKSPPKSELPDLVPLPSYDIHVLNVKAGKNRPALTQLEFAATVWVGGNSRLDVEGFRHNGSPTMAAYQYFHHDGRVVGRTRVGTMGFSGYNHWHFQQFAEYRLLNSKKSLVIPSQKVGFCIAPTDPVDLVLPHATWVPSFTGLSGACGSQSALWTRETMPVGWGDTYFQFVPGQSFDLTHLKNGTYYIEIIANPEGLLHETNTHNDISLRKVIIGGTAGHRTVRVPAFHGIDRER